MKPFPIVMEFNPFDPHLVLYDRKHPIKLPFARYDLKNALKKQFPKMQKQPFANALKGHSHI